MSNFFNHIKFRLYDEKTNLYFMAEKSDMFFNRASDDLLISYLPSVNGNERIIISSNESKDGIEKICRVLNERVPSLAFNSWHKSIIDNYKEEEIEFDEKFIESNCSHDKGNKKFVKGLKIVEEPKKIILK